MDILKGKKSINLLIGLISIVTIFHLLIVLKVIPYKIAWGGRLQNDREMYLFEAVSILINLFFGLIVLMKGHIIKFRFTEKVLNVILWVFFFLFLLNTVGNLFAETVFEKSFSLITAVFAGLIYKVIRLKR